jgi:gliding motility-associated-like protein
MHLKTLYDSCAYSTKLNWNSYNKMPGGLLEYRVYYSVNGAAFNLIGSTTGNNFTHNNVMPSANICYFVRAINNSKTITSSSNRVCFFTNQILAPSFVYIKTSTVQDKSMIQVKVFTDTTKKFTGMDLLRSEDGINYNLLGNLAYNGTPDYVFNDGDVSTNERLYFYKAIVRDGCGNYRTQSQVSKTILLKVADNQDAFFTKVLTWTHYKGFSGGVSGYNIYRILNEQANPIVYAYKGPADSTFIDNVQEEAPNGSKVEYMVEAVEGIGNLYGFTETSKSNKKDVYQEGELFVPNAFSPKGVNKTWLPVTHFIDKNEYKVNVFDRWGKVVFSTTDDKQAWTGDNQPSGIYVYLIQYKNSRGEYRESKGTVLLVE